MIEPFGVQTESILTPPAPVSKLAPASSRIASIDALRGFDMFWIAGGDALMFHLYQAAPNSVTRMLADQFHHVEWEGFHFYDLIFPLFVFIVGLVLPFSLTRRLEAGGIGSSSTGTRSAVFLSCSFSVSLPTVCWTSTFPTCAWPECCSASPSPISSPRCW